MLRDRPESATQKGGAAGPKSATEEAEQSRLRTNTAQHTTSIESGVETIRLDSPHASAVPSINPHPSHSSVTEIIHLSISYCRQTLTSVSGYNVRRCLSQSRHEHGSIIVNCSYNVALDVPPSISISSGLLTDCQSPLNVITLTPHECRPGFQIGQVSTCPPCNS